jgi:arylsulfatase A-like enzyme
MPARHTSPRSRLLVLAALGAAAVCCRRADDAVPRQPIVDLVATFPFTEHRPATERIAFGDPAARPLLGDGWSAPETLEDGAVVRRTVGAVARVAFDTGHEPGPLRVVLHARAELPPGLHPVFEHRMSIVHVRLNKAHLGSVRFSPGQRAPAFDVPRDRLRPGRNELVLRHLGAGDVRARRPGRTAQFLYESIAFEPLAPRPPGPHIGAGGDRLVLPPGTAASFFLRIPVDAELRFGLEPADLAMPPGLVVEGRRVPARRLTPRGHGELAAAIDFPEGSIARIVAEAPADGPELTLVAPAVWGRPPPASPARAAVAAPASPGANVLLYLVDTLRADRLGCYGHPAGLSPAIDRLARDGVVFEDVVAQSSWTRPATASILTGEYPMRHGAISLDNAIASDVTTLAERLRGAGYRTGGFVTNVNVGDQFGFGRGFERYRYLPEMPSRPGMHTPAPELHAEFLRWLDEHPGERFFAYLHASDPHAPYRPAPETTRRLGCATDAGVTDRRVRDGRPPRSATRATDADTAYLRGLYEAEIADLDAAIGTLVDELERRSILERTVVVFVADHGEEFKEHGGFGHGRTLYREQLHVPLIVRLPGRAGAGGRVEQPARQIDVLPTILAVLGLETPTSLPGTSLLDGAGRPTAGGGGETVAETRLAADGAAALVDGWWKAILRQASGRVELYDLRRDPGEQNDQSAEDPLRTGYARQRLLAVTAVTARASSPATASRLVDPATRRRLEALGYLH